MVVVLPCLVSFSYYPVVGDSGAPFVLILCVSVPGYSRREYKDGGDSPYNFRCDKDYYNDLPGKVPPDLLCDNEQGGGGAAAGLGSSSSGLRSGAPGHLNIRVRKNCYDEESNI